MACTNSLGLSPHQRLNSFWQCAGLRRRCAASLSSEGCSVQARGGRRWRGGSDRSRASGRGASEARASGANRCVACSVRRSRDSCGSQAADSKRATGDPYRPVSCAPFSTSASAPPRPRLEPLSVRGPDPAGRRHPSVSRRNRQFLPWAATTGAGAPAATRASGRRRPIGIAPNRSRAHPRPRHARSARRQWGELEDLGRRPSGS